MNAAGQPSPGQPSPREPEDADRRIAAAIRRARLAAGIEVAWRAVLPILWVGGLHAALAWLGVYAALPALGRWGLFGALLGLLTAAVVVAVGRRDAFGEALDRGRAIGRIERASGLDGHELHGLTDRPAGVVDAATARLWAAYRDRTAARIGRLRAGPPRPDLGRRDRYALRPMLGLALFVGWFAAPGDHVARLLPPFGSAVEAVADDRLDVWIDPPAYTGRPPTVLVAEGRAPAGGAGSEGIAPVPAGSRLVVRSASARPDRPPRPVGVTIVTTAGETVAVTETTEGGGSAATAPVERTARLTTDCEIRLIRDGGFALVRRITVTADRPPTVALIGRPEAQDSGALKLTHETGDDWGVAAGEARFAATGDGEARPLVEPPSFPLALPSGRAHTGRTRTIRDVTIHPFAGTKLAMTLHVRDEAGQEGRSETIDVVLPERRFRDPLARALIELRRRLALDARAAAMVATALDALTLAPERFEPGPGSHLGLRFVQRRVAAARDDDGLREVLDLLWVAATTIEDGDLADHEKALRAAQEALRKALEEGASAEEIARLTRDLRQAMDRYLAAKVEQGRREMRSRTASPSSGPRRTITERDIQRMLDRIEALARTGSHEAAEKLLDELRELTENLRSGAAGGEDGEESGDAALEKLGEMIHRQQKLMEETHRSRAAEDGRGDEEMRRLGRGQKDLGEALRRFSDEMKGRGHDPGDAFGPRPGRGGGGEGSEDLGTAAEAMDEAGEALDRGEGVDALDAQARALESLRRGARAMAESMARRGEGARDGGEDPLGRQRRRDGASGAEGVKVPEEIDVERARRILEDIRRRLGEPARPKFERDYLDRLLRSDPRER